MANSKGKSGKLFYLLIAAVVVVGGYLLLAARGSEEAPALAPMPLGVAIDADASAGTPYGDDAAAVTIMDFSDYLCPHCRTFNAMSAKLLRQNHAGSGGSLRWVSYDFPLWPESWAPAIAAQCAKLQGSYWEMHDMLFARVDSWSTERNPNGKFVDYAKDLGLDSGAFKQCVDGQETLSSVQALRAYGESLGISGTPAVFFDGEPVTNGLDYGSLEQRIQAATNAGE